MLWKNNVISLFVASVMDNELARAQKVTINLFATSNSIAQAYTRPNMCF